MKKIVNFFIITIIFFITLVSCEDIFEVDSNRVTLDEDYRMSSPNDTIYAMYGLFNQLQKVVDSYVLLGELRGDLLDVTENSNLDLREINSFEISKENTYANIQDYYSVINNCNYIIQNIDTANKSQKVMYRYLAAVKSMRAWVYMQIALNFGTVKYYEEPILTQIDAERISNYPDISITQLADLLITDLTPWKDVTMPYLFSRYSFPIQFVLGDLYLWKGEGFYDKAAESYYELMYDGKYLINKSYQSSWTLSNNVVSVSGGFTLGWSRSFNPDYREAITQIMCPTDHGQFFDLDSLNNSYQFKPSDNLIEDWDNQKYYNTDLDFLSGDLRKYSSIIDLSNFYSNSSSDNSQATNSIYKYYIYDQDVVVYRSSLLYLRYAEAVNRLGKPNLAFAVLKNGLNSMTMSSSVIIPLHEKTTDAFLNFSDSRFDDNVGIRSRGLGPNTYQDTTYVIPLKPSLADSILYVEDLLVQELAFETAFEGNRFQDLMRFAIRRNDPAYLADKVSAKHTSNKSIIRAKLLQTQNWYLQK